MVWYLYALSTLYCSIGCFSTRFFSFFLSIFAVPGGFGQGEMPSEMDWDKFRTRFERVSKKIIDKMGQNASFMATTVKKSWEQVIRELSGKERPPG